MKRILSILLVALMLVGMLPMHAIPAKAAEESATLALNDSSNRTFFSTTKQVWEANGIIITNNKASSTSNVANYTPPRFYANSELIIECTLGNITKIEIDCDSSSYATAMVNSAKTAGATASASSSTVTITPATVSATFTISEMTAQVRCGKSLTVYYEPAGSACEHTNTTENSDGYAATCTTAGKTNSETCNDCGETVKAQEEIPATGHNYVDGVCQSCRNELPVVSFSVPSQVAAVGSITADEDGKVTLPAAADYIGKYAYTFVGWAEASVSATETAPTVYKADSEYAPNGNTTLYAVYQWSEGGTGGSTEYVLTDASGINPGDTVVIATTKDDITYYAMSNDNGTSSAPSATKVTVSNGKLAEDKDLDSLKWDIGGSKDAYIFYVSGSESSWLYCTSTNNGVRVGTNKENTFKIDATSGYLKHNSTNRYIGIYNNQDWRCYTSVNANITGQTLCFFVQTSGSTTYYTSTLEDVETTCQHTNTTTTTVDATCTTAGSVTVTCDDCGAVISTKEISATGHSYESVVTGPTCTTGGYTTHTCSKCKDSYIDSETAATGHNYVEGICSVCGEEEPAGFDGAYYIAAIRSSGNYWYMTSNLGTASTKRYQAVDTKTTTLPEKITEPQDGYVFVLVKNTDGTYSIYADGIDGDNYLGHSGTSNSGSLEAQANALHVTVDQNDDGTFNIHYKGSDEERYLSLNSSNGSNYFAWYKKTQVYTLKLIPVEVCEHSYDAVVTLPTPTSQGYTTHTCSACGDRYVDTYTNELELKFSAANLTLHNDLTINFKANAELFGANGFTNVYATFLYGNRDAMTVLLSENSKDSNGKYVFPCQYIAPSQVGDEVTAILYGSYNGEQYQCEMTYSVAQYCYNKLDEADETAELKTLVADLLYYCDAARAYTTYQEEVSVTASLTAEQKAYATSATPSLSTCLNDKYSTVANAKATWKGAGLILYHATTMRLRFEYSGNIADLTAKATIGGTEIPATIVNENGKYYVYIEEIKAKQMREEVLVSLYEGETAVSNTICYSVQSYAAAKQNDADSKLAALVIEMIRYGDSAAKYFSE